MSHEGSSTTVLDLPPTSPIYRLRTKPLKHVKVTAVYTKNMCTTWSHLMSLRGVSYREDTLYR